MAQRSWFNRVLYAAVRLAFRCVATVLFRFRVTGQEHWPTSGGALVCANHQSYVDPVLVGVACPRRMNYLARKTLFGLPVLGWWIRQLDAIPIDRDGMGLGGLKETMRRLKRGELVLIFPEGTRTEDGHLQPLKPGFLAVARRSAVPLLPVGIAGAFEAWPRQRRLPGFGKVRLHVGRPLAREEVADCTDEELLRRMSAALDSCLQTARQ